MRLRVCCTSRRKENLRGQLKLRSKAWFQRIRQIPDPNDSEETRPRPSAAGHEKQRRTDSRDVQGRSRARTNLPSPGEDGSCQSLILAYLHQRDFASSTSEQPNDGKKDKRFCRRAMDGTSGHSVLGVFNQGIKCVTVSARASFSSVHRGRLFATRFNDRNATPLILGVLIPSALLIVFAVALLTYKRRRHIKRRTTDARPTDTLSIQDSAMETSRPILLSQFAEHYRIMSADSDFRFSEEFEELKMVGREQSNTFADLPCNRPKNRFTNILPYDHSRFKLQPVDDEEGSDYINANYVPLVKLSIGGLPTTDWCIHPLPAPASDVRALSSPWIGFCNRSTTGRTRSTFSVSSGACAKSGSGWSRRNSSTSAFTSAFWPFCKAKTTSRLPEKSITTRGSKMTKGLRSLGCERAIISPLMFLPSCIFDIFSRQIANAVIILLCGLVAGSLAGGPAHYQTLSGAAGLDGSVGSTHENTQKGYGGDSLSSYSTNVQAGHSYSSSSISRGTSGGLGAVQYAAAAPAIHTVSHAPAIQYAAAAPAIRYAAAAPSIQAIHTVAHAPAIQYAAAAPAIRYAAAPSIQYAAAAPSIQYAAAAPAIHTVAHAPAIRYAAAAPAIQYAAPSIQYTSAPAIHTVSHAPSIQYAAAPAVQYSAARTVQYASAPSISYAAPAISTISAAPAVSYARTISSAPAISYAAPAIRTISAAPAVSYAAPSLSYTRTISAAPAVSYAAPAIRTISAAPAVSYAAPSIHTVTSHAAPIVHSSFTSAGASYSW
ncbi:unnamed protein product [Nesidiocoris tenuis]|uniref:Tyrosine-protein phosphatase domain-containing protein n=1 Tax=Nesidiocoris tenuis TaxID=355587 RepID=A0A6H5GDH6_9HEMI|nr:unnamed protein product [Nesidiocoris tenuis]